MTEPTPGPTPADDPVLVRRAQVARAAVSMAQRVGYALFAVAVVTFFIGFFGEFDGTVVTIIVVTMAVGSVLLAPAIVASYAVKAADREDRELGR